MSSATPLNFWAIAIVGSVALHGAIGMGLYAMPMPEPAKQEQTEITISAPDTGAQVQRAEPEAIDARPAENAHVVAAPSSPTLAASDTTELAARHEPDVTAARTATDAIEAQRAQPAELTPASKATEAVAALPDAEIAVRDVPEVAALHAPADNDALIAADAVQANPTQPDLVQANSATETLIAAADAEIAARQPQDREILAKTDSETAAATAPVAEIAPTGSTPDILLASLPEEQKPMVTSDDIPVAAQPAPTADSDLRAIAPSAGVPAAIVNAAAPSGDALSSAKVVPAQPIAVAPKIGQSGTPAGAVAPQAIGGIEVGPNPDLPAAATSPIEGAPAIAMLRSDTVSPDDDLAVPDSSGMRIEDFLSESEGSDCLLALPLDPMQASVAAYSATPEAVDALGAEYMRVAGLDLKAEMRPVSKAQCGALSFARSLAQYPNFALQLTLNHPTIESGEELSGVVSGLRKDTVYLMIVDDEGKAKLVSSSAVGDVRSMAFSAPMTLTSGPGSAVQLLIAIAADGGLRNLPPKQGEPASEYFSRLTFEIIGDNRSIAYGITSFVVR